jgi:hypothetical protein
VLLIDQLIMSMSNQPPVRVDGVLTGISADNRIHIEGPNHSRSRVDCTQGSFYDCVVDTWIRYEGITTLRLRSLELEGRGTGENSSFHHVLGLLVGLVKTHPRVIHRLIYLPRLAIDFGLISVLVETWKPTLVDLYLDDGGSLMSFWRELLMDTHLRAFGAEIGPHRFPFNGTVDTRLDVIRAICRQSSQPIQALKLIFCQGPHHVSRTNLLCMVDILYHFRPVSAFRLELPSFDGRSSTEASDWVHSVIAELSFRSPKSPFQLGVLKLGLSAREESCGFSEILLNAFPNLQVIVGIRCCKELAQMVSLILGLLVFINLISYFVDFSCRGSAWSE